MTKIRTKTLGGSYEYDTSKAAVMLELCNYEGLCCQTSSLDNPGKKDRDKYDKEDVYTDEAILGNCTKKVGNLEKAEIPLHCNFVTRIGCLDLPPQT